MGSFNVTCSVSNMTIGYGDPVAFIILSPAPYSILQSPGAYHVSNESIYAYFNLAFLPIFGKYDDYGSIDNIVVTRNVEIIENFYGIPIQKVVKILSGSIRTINEVKLDGIPGDQLDQFEERIEELFKMSAMFVHQEIYEHLALSMISGDSWGSIARDSKGLCAAFNLYLKPIYLEMVGFQYMEKTKENRYNLIYQHPELPQLTLKSDGTWVEVYTAGDREANRVYNFHDLNQLCLRFGVDLKIEDWYLRSCYELKYEALKVFVRKYKDTEETIKKIIEETGSLDFRDLDVLQYSLHATEHAPEFMLGHWRKNSESIIIKHYLDAILDESVKWDLIKFMHFAYQLDNTNIALRPTVIGPQCGNFLASLNLAQKIYEICEKRLKDFYEDYE